MILILSSPEDSSTNNVIDWLRHCKKSFIRINDTDKLKVKEIKFKEKLTIVLEHKNRVIDFNAITAYWYRRGDFNFNVHLPDAGTFSAINDSQLLSQMGRNLYEEINITKSFLHLILKEKNGIGSFTKAFPNKLYYLFLAQKSGLKIPTTVISTNKKESIDFIKKEPAITKAISETINFSSDYVSESIMAYTNRVLPKDLNDYPETLFPSLFQTAINKKYELRIFYLNEKCYAMAIFSQSDEKTKQDFRNYNFKKPNRNIPYKLPIAIEKKIIRFMKSADLNTGSIDMLVDDKNNYYFLEVNPVGQYGMTSNPCNYFLDKRIAQNLYIPK